MSEDIQNDATQTSVSEWSEWNPKDYIAEYYEEVIPDCRYAMEWLVDSMDKVPEVDVALEFGTGPIPVFTFPLTRRAREIHTAEYLDVNRQEVKKWVEDAPDAHDWLLFSQEMLRLEGAEPAEAKARAVEKTARERITEILPGDASQANPLGIDRRGFYPLVATHCCAEGATSSKDEWRGFMHNILGLVKPGGILIETIVEAASHYRVGDRFYPAAGVTRYDLLECLRENGFTDIDMRVRQTPDNSEQGFSSCVFVRAIKGSATSS